MNAGKLMYKTASAMQQQFNAAIDYALKCDDASGDLGGGMCFLRLWREGRWDEIRQQFPDFPGPFPE